jgi:hypothetical protein
MKTEPFAGRSAEMRKETPWLSSEDLMDVGHDVEVEIEAVYRHIGAQFDDGRTETVHALKFVGKAKQLILNATNRKRLVALCGSTKVATWVGKKVALYVEVGVRKPGGAKGETTCGIRVRPNPPT